MKDATLAALVFTLGAVARAWNFWGPEPWTDEYRTWWIVAGGWGDLSGRAIRYGYQSPLYYALVKVPADLLGASPAALRLPSLLCGLATLGLAWPLGRRLFGDRHGALLALAAFAVHEPLVWHSQEARPYALALLAVTLSFLFHLRLVETGSRAARVGWVLGTAGAFYAHYLFGLAVVVQGVHLVAVRGRSWWTDRGQRSAWAALGVVSLPGLIHLGAIFGRRESLDWVSPPADFLTAGAVVLELLDPVVLGSVAVGVVGAGIERRAPPGLSLIVAWLLVPILALTLIPPLGGITLLHARYALVSAPAAALVVAGLMASGRRPGWRIWAPPAALLAATLVWVAVPALQASGTFVPRPDEGWRRTSRELERAVGSRDLVVVATGYVEADLLTHADAAGELASVVAWPLAANLAPGAAYDILTLPHRLTDRTQPYFAWVVAQATARGRVWILGKPQNIRPVMKALLAEGFAVRASTRHGAIVGSLAERVAR